MRVQLQEIPDWSPPPAVCCVRALNRWNANLAVQNCRWANWNVPIQLATQNIPQRKMQARSFPPLMQVSRVPLQPKETVENVATPTDAGGNPWHASPHVAYHSAFGCLNGRIPARLALFFYVVKCNILQKLEPIETFPRNGKSNFWSG